MSPRLRRVHPDPTDPITIVDAYDVPRPNRERPWVGLCMVSSLDGSVSLDGTSGGLGNPNDLEVLLTLRRLADVVVVGAGTVAGEGYGPPASGRRVGVVTNSGRIDAASELFRSGAGFVIAPEQAHVPDSIDVLRSGTTEVDLRQAIERMHEIVPGVGYIQAEGGPRLNSSLLDADLIDEVNLTFSPKFVGGLGARLTNGTSEIERHFALAHLLVDDDGYVFSRWVRRRAC
jgi:riboflavin biosynthesis pyrimidine reductase